MREKTLSKISDIYHKHHGVDGYRSMQVYLEREGFSYSTTTVHKYMNSILSWTMRMVNHIKYSKTKYSRTLLQIKSIKNGVPILPTCFWRTMMYGTTVQS